jgi:uncharacterized cupredoxin-like copper-binding protein
MGPGYGPGYGMMGPGYGRRGGYGRHMMGMMAIRTDQSSVKAGQVRFDVTNLSHNLVHELVVVAVDNPAAPLPYDYNSGLVLEKQIKILGETEEMQPNASKTLELTLPAGSYILLCNVAGHYAAGMWMPFTVTAQTGS